MTSVITLSPSALTFDWQGCRVCWWHRFVGREKLPQQRPLPKIFNSIDAAMRRCFEGQPAKSMVPDAQGTILPGETLVSEAFVPEGCTTPIRFRGRTDFLVALADGTWCVPDAKTAEVKEEHVPFYSPQLHAYTWSLLHPAPRTGAGGGSEGVVTPLPRPVTRLGLYVFQPGGFGVNPETGEALLSGIARWMEIPLDMSAFMKLMSEVGAFIDSADLAAVQTAESCLGCQARRGRTALG